MASVVILFSMEGSHMVILLDLVKKQQKHNNRLLAVWNHKPEKDLYRFY